MRQSCICNKANLLAFLTFNPSFCYCWKAVSVPLMSEHLTIPGCGFGKTKHSHLVVSMRNCKTIFFFWDLSSRARASHPVHMLKHCTHSLHTHLDACKHKCVPECTKHACLPVPPNGLIFRPGGILDPRAPDIRPNWVGISFVGALQRKHFLQTEA